jgi:hypothetical protein
VRRAIRKTDPSWAGPRARVGALSRYRPDDDPDLLDARRDLRAARLADYIAKTVDAAPPLSSEQRDRLALLLRGAA